MIKSMTGYGKRDAAWQGSTVTAEVRAVNHRFREAVVRLPKTLAGLEEDVRRLVQDRCTRGRIELTVSLAGGKEAGKALNLDKTVAKQYYKLLQNLQQEFKLGGQIDVAMLASFREIVSVVEEPRIGKGVEAVLKRLVAGALSDLDAMRRREGKVLLIDIKDRLQAIRQKIEAIRHRIPHVVCGHYERMKERVEQLMADKLEDVNRLYQELAVYADRCDVTEELTRLDSHLAQFESSLKGKDTVGRQLDFLLQEMGREVNTLGSKASDAEISTHVVYMKSELEKIREQVQNIE